MTSLGSILIVDDDAEVSELVAEILGARGYSVEVAARGRDALLRVQSRRPDAVILDITLPDISGSELLPKFRALDDSIPVVMLSGTNDEALARSLLNAGAFDYVCKPFKVDALENAVSLAVAVGRARPRSPAPAPGADGASRPPGP